MNRIKLLPHWVLPDTLPSVYDTQSGTALEMVSKVYGAMRDLQNDYNSFVNEINKTIIDFKNGIIQDQEDFKNEINKIVHDYIAMLDLKIAHQDRVIEENIVYIKENLGAEVTRVIDEMKNSGELEEIVADAFNNLSTRFSTIENNISNLENSNTNLIERIGHIENNISTLQDNISNLQNKGLAFEYDSSDESLYILYKEVN